jgi:hypothetical protein
MKETQKVMPIDPANGEVVMIHAYKHAPTGQIFEKKKDYEKCKKAYDEKQESIRKKAEIEANWEKLVNEPRLTATSLQDLATKVMDLYNKINNPYSLYMTKLTITGKYQANVSNSHHCPIGGVTNWGGRGQDSEGKPLPTGYPGWQGQYSCEIENRASIEGKHSYYPETCKLYREVECQILRGKKVKTEMHDIAQNIPGIYIGSYAASSGNQRTYSITLFIDDFPLIKEEFKRIEALRDEAHKAVHEQKMLEAQYVATRMGWVNDTEDIRRVRSAIDECNIAILKATEAKKMAEQSLSITMDEKITEYNELHPFDFEEVKRRQVILNDLAQKLV